MSARRRDGVASAVRQSEGSGSLSSHAEYTARFGARRLRVRQLVPWERFLGFGRLAVVLAGFVFAAGWVAPGWLAVPVAVFVVLLLFYDRVTRASRRAERAAGFYERGLARLEDRWAGTGDFGE